MEKETVTLSRDQYNAIYHELQYQLEWPITLKRLYILNFINAYKVNPSIFTKEDVFMAVEQINNFINRQIQDMPTVERLAELFYPLKDHELDGV